MGDTIVPTQVDGPLHSVTEIHHLFQGDHKLILAVIFIVCAGSLMIPILRLASTALYPAVRVLARLAWHILVEKLVEITVVTTLLWYAGPSKLGAAIYQVAQRVFQF